MKRILLSGILVFTMVGASAQEDELSGEIEKLDRGQLESKTSVPEDPTQSAEEIESELNEEFGIAAPKKAQPQEEPAAPDEIPEDVVGTQEEELPVVEETQSPKDQPEQSIDEEFDEPEQKAQDFKPVPAPEIEEETQESFVEETPEVIEPPAPIVEEEPIQEEVPEPVVEEPRYKEPAPVYTQQETIPDDFEERMHRIYSRFYTEATSETVWTQIAGEKINETYTVQPGDTLWDISVTFFGNGHYWPKVWQMNDNITNPHLVSPGYILKFVPGQINQAPQLNITGNEATPAVPEGPGTTELAAKTEDPKAAEVEAVPVIPPPDKKSVPVLAELPPSLPYIKGPQSNGFDKDGFDIQNQKPKIKDSIIYVPSYLVEEKPIHVGKIVEMNEEDDSTATLYETVFLQMTNGATVGEKLTVYSLGDKIKDTRGNMMGYPVLQEGEVQVQELVNSKEDVYKAIVTRSINNARTGSFVSRSKLITGNTAASGISSPINAEIVGGIEDNDRAFLGFQDVVYLNKGTTEGMKTGQVYTVLKSVRDRKSSSLAEELKEQIAKIKIVQTTPGRSTAVVLQSSQYIRAGDFIGTQAKLPTPAELKAKRDAEDAAEENSDEQSEYEQESELE